MQWISQLETAWALAALGILMTGLLVLKHRLKKRIFHKRREP